jgi:hypothetical protein
MSYEDALATFQAVGRLAEWDDTGAIIRVGEEERFFSRSQVVAGSQMLAKQVVPVVSEQRYERDEERDRVESALLSGETSSPITPSGEAEATQERRNIMFHNCPVYGRQLFASSDGMCSACREEPVTFASLLESVGGHEEFAASVNAISAARQEGRGGNTVQSRLTRELLNLIENGNTHLIPEYQEYLGQFRIGLSAEVVHGPQGDRLTLYHHDYTYYRAEQPHLPHMEEALTGPALRQYVWQANREERQARRQQYVSQVRASQVIEMRWMSREDETDRGATVIGPNTDETRGIAAEYQAAGIAKGYKVTFHLV